MSYKTNLPIKGNTHDQRHGSKNRRAEGGFTRYMDYQMLVEMLGFAADRLKALDVD
ncbi:MAG: hypothetical protein ACJAR0_004653 [Candidatus Azotimanducaceae bacterium]